MLSIVQKMKMFLVFMTAISLFIISGCHSDQKVSPQPLAKEARKAAINIQDVPSTAKKSTQVPMRVTIKNIGNASWPSKGLPDGRYAVHLSYHWLDKHENVVIYEGARTLMPHDIVPNEEVVLSPFVMAPQQPGVYILEFNMVQEAVAWWENIVPQPTKIRIQVE